MNDLDEAIRDALSEDDAAFLARFEAREGLMQEAFGVFRGPTGWINVIFAIVIAVMFGFAVFAGWKFATLADARAAAEWAAMGWIALFIAALVRLWFWMEMHTNRVMREIKRLELQIARLAAKNDG